MAALRWAIALAGMIFVQSAAHAETSPNLPNDERSTVTFVWENDSFVNTDRNYTNGVRLSWLSGTQATDGFTEFVARNILGADEGAVRRQGIAIGHSIFTPTDISATEFIPDQHPYAGWLYGEITGLIEQRNIVDQVSVQIGIVGPSAGGEWVQNEFHALIGADEAKGWDNQLKDELGVNISIDRKFRRLFQIGSSDLAADITPSAGFSAGNINTQARAGLMLRFGQDLGNDYGPPRVRPSLGGAGYFAPKDNFSWYLFAGAEGRAVAHNIFIDGSLIREDFVELTREPLVGDYQAGIVVQLYSMQVAFTMVERSKEFEEQDENQRFGAFSLSRKF